MTQEALKLALAALEINLTLLEKITPYKGQEDFLSDSIAITQDTITAIKEALAQEKTLQALHSENERLGLYKDAYAQPEQEPVAWMYQCTADNSEPVLLLKKQNWAESGTGLWVETPLYTTPPQRTWVGLTDEEKSKLWEVSRAALPRFEKSSYATYAILIEDKFKQKNGYAEEKNT